MPSSSTTLIPMGRTGTIQGRNLDVQSGHSPDSPTSAGRARAVPTLSVSIPVYTISNNPSTKLWSPEKTTDFLPTAYVSSQKDDEQSSEASSICQSPGWEGYDERKRKKQKHQTRGKREPEQDEEKMTPENEVKRVRKLKGSLSKPPSTHKRLTKIGTSMERAMSASMFESSSSLTDPRNDNRVGANRSRRGSLEIGLQSLIQATHAIPVRWKSSQSTPSQESRLSTPAGGFIGGFKLAGEASIRVEIPNQNVSDYNGGHHLAEDATHRRLSLSGATREKSHRQRCDLRPTQVSSFEIQGSWGVPATQQEDRICHRAKYATDTAEEPENSSQISPSNPIIDRNIKRGHKSHSHITQTPSLESRSNGKHVQSDHFYTGKALLHQERRSNESFKIPSNSLTAITSDQSHLNNQDSSTKNRGIPLPLQLRTERRDIRRFLPRRSDRAVDSSRNDHRLSTLSSVFPTTPPGSRRTSLSFPNTGSYSRNSGDESNQVDRSIDREPTDDRHSSKGIDEYHAFLTHDYMPPKLQFITSEARTTPTEADIVRHRRRSFSGPAASSLKGLKNAARAAFSRYSNVTSSTAPEFCNSSQSPTSNNPQSLSRTSMVIDDGQIKSLSKAHWILGKSISSAVSQESADMLSVSAGGTSQFSLPNGQQTCHDTIDWTSKEFLVPHASSAETRIQNPHHTWMTESSEGSTRNESSGITTPSVRRMPSPKEIIPAVRESTARLNQTEIVNNYIPDSEALPNGGLVSMLSGNILNEETADSSSSSHGSWSRTALPFELKDEDEPLKTPTGKDTIFHLPMKDKSRLINVAAKGHCLSNDDANAGEFHRQSNILVRVSTTELEDLSFLPALKHQALTRPTDGKVRPAATKSAKESLPHRDHDNPPIKSVMNPPARSTHVASSSPASPVRGGRYLLGAQSSIPRATRPNTNIDPMAKMFVICCSCRYFHDMPSKIYECMAKPENIVTDKNLGVSAVISTAVKCPWCAHGMSTTCCSGYAAVVYLQEKLH